MQLVMFVGKKIGNYDYILLLDQFIVKYKKWKFYKISIFLEELFRTVYRINGGIMMGINFFRALVSGLPGYFLISYVGLGLLGIKAPVLNYIKIAVINTVILWMLRGVLSVPGVHILLTVLLLTVSIKIIMRLDLRISAVAALLGYILLALGEAVFLPLMLNLLQIQVTLVSQKLSIFILAILINKSFLFIAAIMIRYFNFKVINIDEEINKTEGAKFKDIIIILLIETLLLILLTIEAKIGFFESYFNIENLLNVTVFIAICISILVIILVQELYQLMKRKIELEKKEVKLKSKQKLIEELRSNKHDFSNHLQTIYSMVQLDKKKEVKEYIQSLNKELKNLKVNIANGESTVLESILIPFENQAVREKIKFNYNLEEGIKEVNCPLFKLCRIIFNLVENALEAVEEFEGEKVVRVEGRNKENGYVVSVYNKGPIIEQEKIDDIFKVGVSNKGSDRGFGMHIINSSIKEIGGEIQVKSKKGFGTQFTCQFPK